MSFFKSEMERAYYRTAKKKGWIKEEKLTKTASAKASLKASGDLFVDVCALADAMRSKGYIKQAEDLESKVVAYKQAQVSLFNLHNETGEDLLDMAHPEGDFAFDSNELGDVETQVSQHKKIVDIVKKGPTGKLAEAIIELKKIAGSSQLKDLLGRTKVELTFNNLISSVNSNGLLARFIKTYYGGLFANASSFALMVKYIYGYLNNFDRDLIVYKLNKDPISYLNGMQKFGIKVSHLIPGAQDITTSWFFDQSENIAQDIENQVQGKFQELNKNIAQTVSIINSKISYISNLLQPDKDKEGYKNTLLNMYNDGTIDYLSSCFSGFFGDNYAVSFFNAYKNDIGDLSSDLDQKRVNATVGRLQYALDAVLKSSVAGKHADTISLMQKVIESLKTSKTFSELSSKLSDMEYKTYDELDNDTIQMWEVLKKDIGGGNV